MAALGRRHGFLVGIAIPTCRAYLQPVIQVDQFAILQVQLVHDADVWHVGTDGLVGMASSTGSSQVAGRVAEGSLDGFPGIWGQLELQGADMVEVEGLMKGKCVWSTKMLGKYGTK